MNTIDFSQRNLRANDILSLLKNIQKKDKILCIDLQGNILYTENTSKLFQYIRYEFKSITHLNLSSTHISMDTLFIICNEIKYLENLKSLNLSNNIIIRRSISFLEPILPQLEELNLSFNFIKSQGIHILTKFFSRMKKIKRLYLSNCLLYNSDIYLVAENISKLKTLEYLSLKGNYCSCPIFCYLLLEIPKDNLKYLNLSDICIFLNDYGLFSNKLQYTSFLSSQLELCSNLEVLIWNMYYDFHIMKGIEKCQKLKKLVLSINPFYDEIKISFFPFLKNLESLKVSSIHSDTFLSILKNIPYTIKILSIQYISENNYYSYQFLERILKKLIHLRTLKIEHSSINSFIFLNLCNSLSVCSELQTLSFSNNYIDDKGIYYLSFLLKILKKLNTIYLSYNLITNIGIQYIINILCSKKRKMICNFDNNFIIKKNYFQEYIDFFQRSKGMISESYQWTKHEKEIYSILKSFQPFSHFLFSLVLDDKEKYNQSLFELKKKMNQKKNYLLFNSFMEITKNYHPFFYMKDIQYLIQEYL